MLGWKKHKLESRLPGGNTNHLRYTDDTTLMAESEEELKGLLIKMKEESEKVGLKLNIQKRKIMASGPITSWQLDRKTVETVADLICWGSKITADGDCSHEIQRTKCKRLRDELPQVRGQGQRPRVPGCDGAERPRGATLHLRSGVGAGRRHPVSEVRAAAGRSYPRSGGCAAQEGLEELCHVEGQEWWR